ncbi:MAG: archaemetzincin family Zn-dependent metalloprotease [Desulfobacteraceae bacterium]
MPPLPGIGIIPLGQVDPKLLRYLKTELSKVLPLPVQTLKARPIPTHTYHIVRQQYNSTQLLEYLLEGQQPGLFKILGITGVDLYIPILTYVFGEAQVGGTGAIISLYRLSREIDGRPAPPQVFWPRLVKSGLHELGHTFNLKHCRQPNCIMQFSGSLEKLDQKNPHFCDYCRVLLSDYFNLNSITDMLDR